MPRIAILLTLTTLALAGCGSPNEADPAQVEASQAAEAGKQAERDAAAMRARENEQSLEAFYAGDEGAEDEAEPPEDEPAQNDAGPAAAAPAPAAPEPAPPPASNYQPAPHPAPIPPVQ